MSMTSKRLRNMRPGDRIVYYRGNLALDIERNRNAPRYRKVLEEVRATAQGLEKGGVLILSEQPALVETSVTLKDGETVTYRDKIVEYIAVKQ